MARTYRKNDEFNNSNKGRKTFDQRSNERQNKRNYDTFDQSFFEERESNSRNERFSSR